MSGNSFGEQDEVADALNSAVNDYGKRVLSDPRMLSSLVGDLIPDLPRERSLLVTGAEAGIADELSQRVEGQRLDPNTAVNLVAESLMRSRGLDQASSAWVANEYAQALGYQVNRGDTQPIIVPPPFPPAPTPPPPPGGGAPSPVPPTYVQSPQNQPPSFPPQNQNPSFPPQNFPQQNQPQGSFPPPSFPPQNQPPGNFPPGNFPQQTFPQNQPPAKPPRNQSKSPRLALFGGAGVLAVVVVYLIIAATAHLAPFSKAAATKSPQAAPTLSAPVKSGPPPTSGPLPTSGPPPTKKPVSPSASPSSTITYVTLPAGYKKLKVLLPTDVEDAASECGNITGITFDDPGLVAARYCDPTDLGTGFVQGYQFDSPSDYNTAWTSFNKVVARFGRAPSADCPPAAGDDEGGPEQWHGHNFASRSGQVLECYTTTKKTVVFAWTYPTENSFLITVAPAGWTFSKLATWWGDNSV